MRTLKAFLVSFLVSLLSFNAIGEEYYVSVGGSGKQDGSSWENSMDGQKFAKKLSVAKSGTIFYLMEGKYYPEDGTKGFIITNGVSLFGGYTEEMTKDETITFDDGTWNEEHMSILVGDISINEGGNTPVTIKLGEDERFLSERVSTQSSSVEGAFIASVPGGSGAEIVLRKGVFYKSKPSPMEENIIEDTVTVNVGSKVSIGNSLVVYFGTIGDTVVSEDPVITEGVMTTKIHHVQVLPNFGLDAKNRWQYYVKEKATGTGDGSSWENAMSGASFAYAFDKVVNNVTFHFAAGTYEPTQSYTYEGESYICFGTSKCVNLIGGYGENPSQGDGTNVRKNKTIFKGSVKTLLYNPESDNDISISGIEVSSSGTNALAFMGGEKKSTLTLDSCSFYGAYTGVALTGVDTAYISSCYFHDNTGFGASAFSCTDVDRLVVTSSLFSGNHLSFYVSDLKDVYINNSTFYDNTFNVKGDKVTLVNNTFCSGYTSVKNSVLHLMGNLCTDFLSVVDCEVFSSMNVMLDETDTTSWASEGDVLVSVEQLKSVIPYDDSNAPILADNGGFTKTIALLSDTLYSGISIRFNRKGVTDVDVDQRGIARPDSTCMGAYEIGLNNVTIPLSDTTVIAGTYKDVLHGGKSVDLGVGLVAWCDTVKHTEEGVIDSIFTRMITVLPKSAKKEDGSLHYYVKEDGTGDGSSWINAMGNEAFAFAFNRVEDGATFHVAQGTYTPVYDKEGDSTNIYNRTFYTTKLVNLQGGYPADVMEEVEPQPENYRAVFNGDYENFSVTNVVHYVMKNPGTVSVSGISFSGSAINTNPGVFFRHASLGFECVSDNARYVVSDCDFSKSYTALRSQSCSGLISGCLFNKNSMGVDVSGNEENDIRINSSTFDRMAVGVTRMDSCVISNSTFTYDPMSICGLSVGKYGNVNSLSLENNTILGDVQIGDSVKASILGNIMESVTSGSESITTADNIYVGNEYLNVGTTVVIYDAYSSSDIKVSPTALQQILEYKDSAYVLKDNGGHTPTVALVTDTLLGNITIRYNHKGVTDEVVDQRGNVRPDSTCMGAYEFGFTSIYIPLADTTVYAGSYTDMLHGGKTISLKIGDIAWVDTVYGDNANAYDTIFTRNITVLPSGKKDTDGKYHYYVKETGSGDGSSWDEAMGPWSFAFSFDKVQDGATFHIAEGIYYPTSWYEGPHLFRSDKVVNLIGGYAASSSNEIALRNISKYPTKLTGNYKSLSKVVELNLPEQGNLFISGINFEESSEDTTEVNFAALMLTSKGATFSLDSCSFNRTRRGVLVDGCSGSISNCSFTGTKSYGETDEELVFEDEGVKFTNRNGEVLSILSSSFVNELSCIDGIGSLSLKNSTIANSGDDAIVSHIYVNGDAEYVMENNTILSGGVTLFDGYEYKVVGNIFGSSLGSSCENVNSSDNVFLEGMSACLAQSSNIQLSEDQFATLFVGGTSPSLTQGKNGTYYAELLTDELSGGLTIRFDLSKTSVQTDQRGAKRHSLCCAGAYELGCPTVSQLYDDLVAHVGERLMDEEKHIDTLFTSIGRYEWTKTISSDKDDECTLDYSYVVSVLPNPMKDENGKLHYYVKVDGKGDGSSWEKAMGSAAFAYAFDKVEDGSTFHVAEGVYNPIYEGPDYSNSDNRSAKSFYTTKLVNIIGGYSKDESDISALPDTSYHTILEGAQDQMSNGTHTSVFVLTYCPKTEGHFSVEYVDIRRSTRYRQYYGTVRIEPQENAKVNFTFNHCNFEKCEGGILSQGCGGTIRYCQFDGIDASYSMQMFGKSQDSLIIESSYIGKGCYITDYNYRITNSTVYGLVEEYGSDSLFTGIIENSTMVKFEAGAARNHVFKGNIFYGLITLKGNAGQMVTSSYNIYPAEASIPFLDSNTDLLLDEDDYFYVLDHDSTGLVSGYNGGYTKTIALNAEMLPDSTSLRYNRMGVTSTVVDQRGVQRPASTCRGAYEFGCTSQVVFKDTVLSYIEGRIPGRYCDTLNTIGADGCKHDSVVSYMMLPPDLTECYVTVDGANSKTGADWKNAISAELFAYSLLYAKNTKKYFIAEGMYVPLLDSTGKIPDDLSQRVFSTKRSVSLIGGYTNRAKEGYEQNLKENFTCIGDTLNKNQNNIFIADISSVGADTIYFSGIEFSSAKDKAQTQGDGEGAAVMIKTQNEKLVVKTENCTFTKSYDGLFVDGGSQIIKDVNFTDNKHAGISLKKSYKGAISIESSSFLRNGRGLFGNILSGTCYIGNSTFYNKDMSIDLSGVKKDSAQLRMEYNTIWGDTLNLSMISFSASANVFGAVLKGNELKSEGQLSYNLCLNDENNKLYFKGNNWFVGKEEFLSVLDMQPSYIPNLWDDNGNLYTSLIQLKGDLLSDNTVLRLPILKDGDSDQRGMDRLEMTCPGSYELLIVHDTVYVGMSKHGITFNEIGVIDTTKDGVRYEVWVLPNKSIKSYYVKVNGTGDGTSWAKAMSVTDFKWFFPQAESGSTFYVAEGTYSFSNDQMSDDGLSVLSTDKFINIEGGYPADITDVTQSADPVSYVESTIFKGSNGYILNFVPTGKGSIHISGITFEDGVGHVRMGSVSNRSSLEMERCRFVNSSASALSVDSCNVILHGCLFEIDSVGIGYAGGEGDSLCIYSSTFSDDSLGVVVQGNPNILKIVNSTFLGDEGLAVDYRSDVKGSLCYLYNNTIMQNLSFSAYGSNEWIGNIFGCSVNVKTASDVKTVNVDSRYNIYLKSSTTHTNVEAGVSDKVVTDEDMRSLFGVGASESYELTSCGDLKVLQLVKDVLPEGDIVRFSLEEAKVTTDQCGKQRKFRTCMGAYELSRKIAEMDIPTAFTPYTQDGKNDVFMPDYELYVYDRYGNLISHSMNGWDGTYNGKMADPGVYIYVLLDPEGDNRKGTVELYKIK